MISLDFQAYHMIQNRQYLIIFSKKRAVHAFNTRKTFDFSAAFCYNKDALLKIAIIYKNYDKNVTVDIFKKLSEIDSNRCKLLDITDLSINEVQDEVLNLLTNF